MVRRKGGDVPLRRRAGAAEACPLPAAAGEGAGCPTLLDPPLPKADFSLLKSFRSLRSPPDSLNAITQPTKHGDRGQ